MTKTSLVFNTSKTPQERDLAVFGDPLERLWKDCICTFLWDPGLLTQDVRIVVTGTCEQRKGMA